jgi:hypothetical protein
LRLILAAGNIAAFFRPTVHMLGIEYRLFDVGGVVAAVGIFAITVYAAIAHANALYEQEPLSACRRHTAEDGCATRASRVTA